MMLVTDDKKETIVSGRRDPIIQPVTSARVTVTALYVKFYDVLLDNVDLLKKLFSKDSPCNMCVGRGGGHVLLST
jgi:hypothetical protein